MTDALGDMTPLEGISNPSTTKLSQAWMERQSIWHYVGRYNLFKIIIALLEKGCETLRSD
jgi:hypothetical protein